MEPLAVNYIRVTPELFQESFSVVFDKRKQKTLLICGVVFAVFGLLSLLIQYFLHRMIVLGAPVLMMGCVVIGWSFLLPVTERRKKYKALCRKNSGAPVERTIEFFENGLIVHTEDEAPIEIDYSDIREWRETEHLSVLVCEGRMGILLAKDGFQSGLLDTVRKLAEKRQADFSATDAHEG